MRAYVLGALLLSAVGVSAADDLKCYWRRLDQTQPKTGYGWFACNNTAKTDGGAELCCRNGDRCGDDSICHTDNISQGSAYYIGGCTDGSYEDDICRTECSGYKQTYIDWNRETKLWDCCGDYDCLSDNATDHSLKGVSPAEWEPIPQKGNFNPDDDDDDDNGIELSTAAKAGIGVGAGVAVIAVIALVTVCCIRRRRPAERKTFGNGQKGTYARLGPQHEMAPYAGGSGQGMPRSREPSPAPASRGVSPSRSPLVSGYGNIEPPTHAAAQSASMYPDKLAARAQDDGA